MLAARNEGVGSCWIGAIYDREVKKIFNVPDDVDVVMTVPLGYPLSDRAFIDSFYRKPFKEICFSEKYGQRKT